MHWEIPATFLTLNDFTLTRFFYSWDLTSVALVYFLRFAWLNSVCVLLCIIIWLLHIVFIHGYYLSYSNLIYLFIYLLLSLQFHNVRPILRIVHLVLSFSAFVVHSLGVFIGSERVTYMWCIFVLMTDVKCKQSPLTPPAGEQLLLVHHGSMHP